MTTDPQPVLEGEELAGILKTIATYEQAGQKLLQKLKSHLEADYPDVRVVFGGSRLTISLSGLEIRVCIEQTPDRVNTDARLTAYRVIQDADGKEVKLQPVGKPLEFFPGGEFRFEGKVSPFPGLFARRFFTAALIDQKPKLTA
jgi:hypothetical protein